MLKDHIVKMQKNIQEKKRFQELKDQRDRKSQEIRYVLTPEYFGQRYVQNRG